MIAGTSKYYELTMVMNYFMHSDYMRSEKHPLEQKPLQAFSL